MTTYTFAKTISFQDPDYAAGAIEREAEARQSLYQRQIVAATNLNTLVAKYKLGNMWKVDTSSSICGTFVMPDYSKGNIRGVFKATIGKLTCNLWVSGRYENLVFTVEGVALQNKETCLERIKQLLPDMYFLSVQSTDKSVSFNFGSPSSYSDPVKFKNLKKVFEYFKKEDIFKAAMSTATSYRTRNCG